MSPDLPCFRIWHARQLVAQDLLFTLCLFCAVCIHAYRSAPFLCQTAFPSITSFDLSVEHAVLDSMTSAAASDACSAISTALKPTSTTAQKWPFAWQLVCGQLTGSSTTKAEGVSLLLLPSVFGPLSRAAASCTADQGSIGCGVATIALAVATGVFEVVLYILQGLTAYFGFGWLIGDPCLAVMAVIRAASLLLLLPRPRLDQRVVSTNAAKLQSGGDSSSDAASRSSSSSSNRAVSKVVQPCEGCNSSSMLSWHLPRFYWQYPAIRQSVVIAQRLVPIAVAAILMGFLQSPYKELTVWYKWATVLNYIGIGWIAFALVLPLRLHLVVSAIEWALTYYTAVASRLRHCEDNNSLTFAWHLVASLLCVVVLPTMGVAWLERLHRSKYEWATRVASHQQHQGLSSLSKHYSCAALDECASSSSSKKVCSWSTAAAKGKQHTSSTGSGSNAAVLATTPTAATRRQDIPAVPAPVQKPASAQPDFGIATNLCGMPQDIAASLHRVLRDDQVDDIFTAAAKARRSARPYLQYKSMVSTLPVSIKLPDAHHNGIPVIGPLLTGTLEQHVAAAASRSSCGYLSAAQVHSLCFQGCIQMLANIYHIEDPAAATEGHSSVFNVGYGSDGPAGTSSNHTLSSVSTNAEFAAALLWDVSSKVAAHAANSSQGAIGTDMHIMVGDVFKSTTAAAGMLPSIPSGEMAAMPAVRLLRSQPSCLLAGHEQHVTLTVKVAASAASSAAATDCSKAAGAAAVPCRLVAFQRGMLVADQEVTLNRSSADGVQDIRVEFPSLSVGVLHVALMPGSRQQLVEQQQSVGNGPATQPWAASSPLLLQPLPVLPGAAATELDAFWQEELKAVAEAVGDGNRDAVAEAWQNITDLTVDFAYLLEAAAAASSNGPAKPAAAADNTSVSASKAAVAKLPDGPKSVLLNLSRYLVLCQLWQTLAAMVEHVAAAAAAAGTAASSTAAAAAATGASVASVAAIATVVPAMHSAAANRTASTPLEEYEPDSKPVTGSNSISDGGSSIDSNATIPAAAAPAAALVGDIADNVSMFELLYGLKDRQLESSYRATQFRTSGGVDMFTFGFCGMLSSVCWLISFCTDVKDAFATPSMSLWWISSFILTNVFTSGLPLAVMLLRRSVASAVQDSRCSTLQQQQQGVPAASTRERCRSAADPQQPHGSAVAVAAAAETAIYIKAAHTKHLLIVFWILILELGNIGIAYKWILIPPSFPRVYATRSLPCDLASGLTHAMKGAFFQVSYRLFIPLILVDTAVNCLQNYEYGLQPTWWLLVRFGPGLLVALLVAAHQHITGRRRFLQARRLSMGAGSMPGSEVAAAAGKVKEA